MYGEQVKSHSVDILFNKSLLLLLLLVCGKLLVGTFSNYWEKTRHWTNIHVTCTDGFFLRRRNLRVENNNKFCANICK